MQIRLDELYELNAHVNGQLSSLEDDEKEWTREKMQLEFALTDLQKQLTNAVEEREQLDLEQDSLRREHEELQEAFLGKESLLTQQTLQTRKLQEEMDKLEDMYKGERMQRLNLEDFKKEWEENQVQSKKMVEKLKRVRIDLAEKLAYQGTDCSQQEPLDIQQRLEASATLEEHENENSILHEELSRNLDSLVTLVDETERISERRCSDLAAMKENLEMKIGELSDQLKNVQKEADEKDVLISKVSSDLEQRTLENEKLLEVKSGLEKKVEVSNIFPSSCLKFI